jgi:hypothetical protein
LAAIAIPVEGADGSLAPPISRIGDARIGEYRLRRDYPLVFFAQWFIIVIWRTIVDKKAIASLRKLTKNGHALVDIISKYLVLIDETINDEAKAPAAMPAAPKKAAPKKAPAKAPAVKAKAAKKTPAAKPAAQKAPVKKAA